MLSYVMLYCVMLYCVMLCYFTSYARYSGECSYLRTDRSRVFEPIRSLSSEVCALMTCLLAPQRVIHLVCFLQTTGIVSQKEQPPLPHPLHPTKVIDNSDGKMRARRVDKISRKAFPMAFLLFNIVYWLAYTIPSGPPDDSDQ